MSSSKAATVFGATGFVGSHVTKALLEQGWTVRGVSRNASKASWLQALGAGVTLADIDLTDTTNLSNQLDTALNGSQAAFFCSGTEKQDPTTIDFMVGSTLAILDAAVRQKVGVVVLTSSGGSTNPPGHKNETPKKEHEHWSDPEQQLSVKKYSPAAKTQMELKSLARVGRNAKNEIVDEELAKNSPRLCIMNPNMIVGPQLQPGPPSGNSLPYLAKILKGELMNEKIPNDSMSIIDVRDLAKLHVACATLPEASGRYFGVQRSFPWEEILGDFKKAYDEYKVPPRFEGESNVPTQFDFTRRDSLGVQLTPLEQTFTDLIAYMKSVGTL
eukprot:TRINITY_DN84921_c0_g1_i1.p1 TRINITY_DN84921_c0_g1~~TRINITY_DN84921_c0_g1_i1.p1  ORF type:complete len:329 (-),score=56.09 TRINITY_DN84921_c0_g1_i1:103-1089(-)